jgi:hypothetical protein
MAGRIAYYGNIVRDGLVLDLDAAKRDSYPGSGTVWRDIAGGVITGSLVNGPTFDSNNGGSIVFDGVNDHVTCGVISTLPSGTQNRTLMGWVQDNSLSDFVGDLMSVFGYGSDASTGNLFMVSIGGTTYNNRKIIIWTNTVNHVSSFSINRNEWTHITATVTQDSPSPRLTIYKNGVSDGGSIRAINTINTGPFSLADSITSGPTYDKFLNGRISQVQVYNRALNASEVLQNFNATRARFGI